MRAFVVGNGHSLKEMDLDLLIGEVTFAMNRIDLIYEPAPDYGIRGTAWRPTYYLFIEWLAADNPKRNDRHPNDDAPKYIDPSDGLPRRVFGNPFRDFVLPYHVVPGVERCIFRLSHYSSYAAAKAVSPWRSTNLKEPAFVPISCAHGGMYVASENRPMEWHLPVWCHYGGTMNVALQFAFAMGYDPVYVIACDLGIQPIFRTTIADPNHFHPDYWTWEDNPLEDRDPTLIEVHRMAQEAFDRAGRHIYNAGVGGKLDVHPRVEFASLF